MTIAAITKLMVPPTEPILVPRKSDWHGIESRLGWVFPSDYKRFSETYGYGCVDGFLWVLSPVGRQPHEGIEAMRAFVEEEHTLTKQKYKEFTGRELSLPYSCFPEKGGLLPWARTNNGDRIHWRVDSGGVTVVIEDREMSQWQEFELKTLDFLAKVLEREIVIDAFPENFPKAPHHFFVPNRTR
ncbi:MAG: hypothetical protein EHM37_15115 [Deltaproteobacteria bacterium]|nr:MAG: hypothetical protein EHM37_15115 [Deltaproteobacteria bacterium]